MVLNILFIVIATYGIYSQNEFKKTVLQYIKIYTDTTYCESNSNEGSNTYNTNIWNRKKY